ncbi:MAG: hypothetical protein N3A54_06110 [Patescibacteria group bacterium]|nr:hypothetical protein [Patescibacteria group bacterium]
MNDVLYEKILKRWEEVTQVPPQNAGPLTPFYKDITKRLKVMPWPSIVLMSIVFVGVLYCLLGSSITFLATILQRGF